MRGFMLILSSVGALITIFVSLFLQNKSFAPKKPNAQTTDVIVVKDISYGPDEQQKLDICAPRSLKKGDTISLVILSHGGGGDKQSFLGICKVLANRGFVAATVNFREEPPPAYPNVVEDVKLALTFLNKLAENRGINIHRTGAWGGSLGGYLSSMLGTNEFENKVSCVNNNFGPTDFTNPSEWEDYSAGVERIVSKFFGGVTYEENPELYEEASAVTYVSANDAGSWLFTRSTNDKLVPRSQMTLMMKALENVGIETEFYEYTGFGPGHANKFILKLGKLLEKRFNFMEECLNRE